MITALMGFVTALFFELFVQIKLRFRLYKMGRQVKSLEEELVKLKSVQNSVTLEKKSVNADEALLADEKPAPKPGAGMQ